MNALDRLCAPEQSLWWTHRGSVLIRKRDYYLQEEYEVPDAWLDRVSRKLSDAHGTVALGDLAALRELTPSQLDGLNSLPRGGYVTESDHAVLLPDLLALLDPLIKGKTRPLPTQAGDGAPREPLVLAYDGLTLAQKAALDGFARRHGWLLTRDELALFRVEISAGPVQELRGYRSIPAYLRWGFGAGRRVDAVARLPLSVPDDRRAAAQVVRGQ